MSGNKLRLRFSKFEKAKHISHLDLMATLRRALLRAGVGLKYSQGFNPHPYMSIALPLSVGCSSMCELIDVGTEHDLLPDGLPEIINAVLPEGIEVLSAYAPLRKFSGIAWVEVEGSMHYDNQPRSIVDDLSRRFSQESIIIAKKTKRGVSEINIAPFIKNMCYNGKGDGTVAMKAMLSAQNPSVNPYNIIDALSNGYASIAPDFAEFTRTEVFDADFKVFS